MEDGSYTLGGANSWGSCLIRTKPDTTHIGNAVVLLDPAFPSQFVVSAPYPNPFNSTMTISFSVRQASLPVNLAIYDLSGRMVADLLGSGNSPFRIPYSALQSVVWNASGVPAGQYIIKLANGNYSATKTVTLIK